MKKLPLWACSITLCLTSLCSPAAAEQNPCTERKLPEGSHHFKADAVHSIRLENLQTEVVLYKSTGSELDVHQLHHPSGLQVALDRGVLSIQESQSDSANRISVSGGPNTVVKATINGRPVEIPAGPPPQIVLCVPRPVALSAKNLRVLSSNAPLLGADLTLNGAARASLSNLDGGLKAALTGSARATVTGDFEQVEASTEGAARLETDGDVEHNFEGRSSGASAIRHYGTIGGELKKQETALGKVLHEAARPKPL